MLRFLIGILLAGTLSACANVYRFEKSSLVAHGEILERSDEPLYYSIQIDLKQPIDTQITNILLKLSTDSPPIAITQLRSDLVSRYLSPFIPPPQWPETWKKKAEKEVAYTGNGFYMRFREDQLQAVGICSHCAGERAHPVIGTSDGRHFYALPLTIQQLTEVFGSPDRIYKVNEVYY
jgi:hypothetical protein